MLKIWGAMVFVAVGETVGTSFIINAGQKSLEMHGVDCLALAYSKYNVRCDYSACLRRVTF